MMQTKPSTACHTTHWVYCPVCSGKTRIKVYENTVLLWFPLYCPKCRKETMINVVNMKMTQCLEPDAYHAESRLPTPKSALFLPKA